MLAAASPARREGSATSSMRRPSRSGPKTYTRSDTVGQPICGAAHQYTATTTTTASTSFSATPTSLYAAYSASGTSSSASQLTRPGPRSEEHTSELQSLMRISYAVFCLKKKKHTRDRDNRTQLQIKH